MGIRFAAAMALLVAWSAAAGGQGAQDAGADRLKARPVPGDSRPMPFDAEAGTPGITDRIEFRAADEMSARDRDLEADAEASILEHAGRVGLEFNRGAWNYRQVVCPAFPKHMFLKFTRNNGTGDVSVFSASIPRNGVGRVRIIPILLRGYSLFSPAPVNAMTVSAFNHIRAEEGYETSPDWLGTGLCYAALAGGRAEAEAQERSPKTSIQRLFYPWSPSARDQGHPDGIGKNQATAAVAPEGERFPKGVTAVLEVGLKGEATIRFLDGAETGRPMEWGMVFDRRGRLVKATHLASGMLAVDRVPEGGEAKGRPLAATAGVAEDAGELVRSR